MLVLLAPALRAEDFAPLTITWRHSVTANIPGVTRVVPFEDSICHVEVTGDHVKFEGVARGDTPVFVWQGEKQSTIMIHVVEEEEALAKNSLHARDDGRSNGIFSSNMQYSNQNSRLEQLVVANHLDWNDQSDGHKLHLQIEAEKGPSFQSAGTGYNVRTASVQYIGGHGTLSLLDYSVDVSGGIRSQMTPYLSSSTLLLRGASYQTKLFDGTLNLFAGATLPPNFLYFGGTRDVAGASWRSSFTEHMRYSFTAAATSVPLRGADGIFRRSLSYYGLSSVQAEVSSHTHLEAVAGISNRGGLVQAAVSYSKPSLTAFATSTFSAINFPLNQLRLLPSGHLTASGGANAMITPKITATILVQNTTSENNAFLNTQGSSQHVNPSINFSLTSKNRLTLNYTFDHTTGAIQSAGRSTGNRLDTEWSSQFGQTTSNTLRVSKGVLSDPFENNSRDNWSFYDGFNWRPRRDRALKGMSFLGSYNRVNTSLAAKLAQDLALLSPALQQLYYLDPAGFLQQQNLPPGLLNLLNNLRPSSLSLELDTQFAFGSRFNISPNLSYMRSVQSISSQSAFPAAGFTLNYQLALRTSLHSTLSNTFLLTNAAGQLRRVTVFAFGVQQGLSGIPRWMTTMSGVHGTILGRVFRDANETGAYKANEAAFAGVHVTLSNGAEAYTDAQGRYRFDKLPLGEYVVHLPVAQFSKAVRLTTPGDYKFDLARFHTAQADFGIIDFSRVRGSVFNDYLNAGSREPDAAGIADVRVILSNWKGKRELLCDASGEFEFNNIDPGKYQLSIDNASIPDNYQVGKLPASEITVQSAHTVTVDIPLIALRSVQGFVLHKVKGKEQPEPVPGVTVRVGSSTAITNKEGSFLLRDLPAGDAVLQLVPLVPLPAGKKAPSGTLHISRGPMEGRGIRIVLSDEELIRYFVLQKK